MSRIFGTDCIVVLLLAALGGAAQTPQPSRSSPQSSGGDQIPVFRASARLVQVSVVVHDSHGQPVTDLKKEDFAIAELGKPQQISFFSTMSADKSAAPAAPSPPHIFTNVVAAAREVPTNVTVVLLDLLNTRWVDQIHARKALLTFLQQIHPQDRIALFALSSRSLTRLHDYTTDSASLVERLKKASGEIPSHLDASAVNPDLQSELERLGLEVLAEANQAEADFLTAGRIVNTLSTLQVIAQHLSGVPGRKNLIWLSDGFPLTIGFDDMPRIGSIRDHRTFTLDMDSAVRALNNSGVSVYPVDARGLMAMPGFGGGGHSIPTGDHVVSATLSAINDNIDSMRALASRTGGRAAYNTNDLTGAIRQAIDDARVTYTLGYYSTDEIQDGRFREIKVKVNRPHVDVRYRKGYFALKPTDDSATTREGEVRTAVWSPLESTAIALNARADIIDQPTADTVNVIVQIDPTAVSFTKDGDRWKTDLDVAYVQKDEHGRLRGEYLTDAITLALTDAGYRQAMKDGLIRERRFRRDPEAVNVRIVVRDVANGAVGSLTIPFSQIAGPAQY